MTLCKHLLMIDVLAEQMMRLKLLATTQLSLAHWPLRGTSRCQHMPAGF
jgi:hypothetical protein